MTEEERKKLVDEIAAAVVGAIIKTAFWGTVLYIVVGAVIEAFH